MSLAPAVLALGVLAPGVLAPRAPPQGLAASDPFAAHPPAAPARPGALGTSVPFCVGNGADLRRSPCPCGSVGAPGHGCPNSQVADGAALDATGQTPYGEPILAATGMTASSVCVFLQGSVALSPAVPFGDGHRCVGGWLLRLWVEDTGSGAASFPDLGDPFLYGISAALGDVIPPGGVRHYQVAYRDPDPAFCPAPYGGGINITNAVSHVW